MSLPDVLVVDILSRLSAASLARLRAVSKEWNALIIKDERLAKKHTATAIMLIDFRVCLVSVKLHQTDNNKVKVISQFSLKDPLSNNSLEEVDIRDVFHCDGLLLCITKDNRLVVWNPCSRETRWIQPRYSYHDFYFFTLCKSSCNKYKILRVNQRYMDPASLEFEIYDFTSNSWRGIGETRDWFIRLFQSRSMSVKGSTYWLAFTQEDHRRGGDFLLSFDFSTERFGRVSLPVDLHTKHHVRTLSVTREEQQLCLLATRWGVYDICGVDVWIANEVERNGAASWRKFLYVDLTNLHKPFCFCNGMNFLVDQENKVLVCRGRFGVSNSFVNIVRQDKCIQVDHIDAESTCSLVLSYVPTFVQIQ